MKTGELIRKARKKRKLTQKQLGDLCGINEVQIRRYELGGKNSNPKIETLHKIAHALNIPVTELIEPDVLQLSNDVIDLFTGSDSFKLDFKQSRINELFDTLNETGKDKAIEQVELLTRISEYRKDK